MQPVDMVIIESLAQDAHAHALGWALQQRGATCAHVFADNFPSRATIDVAVDPSSGAKVRYSGPESVFEVGSGDRFAYWSRRASGPYNVAPLADDDMPAAGRENRAALSAFRELLGHMPGATFVNPLAARSLADRKPVQLHAAADLGFRVPRSLFSNNPERILKFISDEGGKVIFKTSTPMSWRRQGEGGLTRIMTYSHLVVAEQVAGNPTISACSGIYQQPIAKSFEARLTVMGETCFATRIHSQENPRTLTDWRVDQANLRIDPMSVPPEVAEGCVAFLRRLGLLMGCFDFIVTPDDEWFFLECNEQGQWLWQESHCPQLTLLDAFAEFIRAPHAGFRYAPPASPLRLRDYMRQWGGDLRQSMARNVVRAAAHVRIEGSAA